MLDDLLQRWKTASVASTREISLAGQVESELEARFWKVLKDWAVAEPAVSLTPARPPVNGQSAAALRRDSAHWQVAVRARGGASVRWKRFAPGPPRARLAEEGGGGPGRLQVPRRTRSSTGSPEDADKRAGLGAEEQDRGAPVRLGKPVSDIASEAVNEGMPWPPVPGRRASAGPDGPPEGGR